jgi:hypothetical protein
VRQSFPHFIRNALFASVSSLGLLAITVTGARAQLLEGDLVISTSTFQANTGEAAGLTVGQLILIDGTNIGVNANATDANLSVFSNSAVDGNFGITSPLSLISVNPTSGHVDATLALPTSQIVTSFPSKSEGSIYLSQDGHSLTIAGYHVPTDRFTPSPVGALDVSNSSTTAFPDTGGAAGNSPRTANRTVAQVGFNGLTTTTDLTAYSGNNARGAVLVNGIYYTAGNGNLGNTGVEELVPGSPVVGTTSNSNQVGQFSITQYGFASDKPIKDNNFRGITTFNNTLYVTKGSGSNGINTVYQVGAAGALAGGANLAANATTPITILPGFPTALARSTAAKGSPVNAPDYTPFGMFFANDHTLYIGDEGTGDAADIGLGSHAGLEKWSLVNGTWQLDYTLQTGLIGTSQTYSATGFTGSVFENGLRDIAGKVNADGTVTSSSKCE